MTAVTRIYRYYFDRDEEHDRVRLRDTVVHARRGCADVHYTAYKPDRTHSSDCCDCTSRDFVASADKTTSASTGGSPNVTSPAAPLLQSSAVTRTFPVLRPVIVSTVKLAPLQRRSQNATPSPPPVACISAGTLVPRVQQTTSPWQHRIVGGDDPFAANEPHEWPLYARLACCLPFEHAVSLAHAARLCRGAVQEEVEQTVREAMASQWTLPATAFLYDVAPSTCGTQDTHVHATTDHGASDDVGAHNHHGCLLRHRPFWLAPHCQGERRAAELPHALVHLLHPAWTSLHRILNRLDRRVLANLLSDAVSTAKDTPVESTLTVSDSTQADIEGVAANVDACVSVPACGTTPSQQLAVARYLQRFGHCCCVDVHGLRVRRYTANSELDDVTHLLILLLRRCATTRKQPLHEVLTAMEGLCAQCRTDVGPTEKARSCTNTYGLAAQLRYCMSSADHGQLLLKFLQSHTKEVEISASSETDVVYVKRRTQYATLR